MVDPEHMNLKGQLSLPAFLDTKDGELFVDEDTYLYESRKRCKSDLVNYVLAL